MSNQELSTSLERQPICGDVCVVALTSSLTQSAKTSSLRTLPQSAASLLVSCLKDILAEPLIPTSLETWLALLMDMEPESTLVLTLQEITQPAFREVSLELLGVQSKQ